MATRSAATTAPPTAPRRRPSAATPSSAPARRATTPRWTTGGEVAALEARTSMVRPGWRRLGPVGQTRGPARVPQRQFWRPPSCSTPLTAQRTWAKVVVTAGLRRRSSIPGESLFFGSPFMVNSRYGYQSPEAVARAMILAVANGVDQKQGLR